MRVLIVAIFVCAVTTAADPEPKNKEGPLDRGATKESEEAVAKGLRWLALHQNAAGHWSLHTFNRDARTDPIPKGKAKADDSTPETTRNSNVAGTAFALLPFLAAGHTHKKAGPYQKAVQGGLNALVKTQTQVGASKGQFGSEMYAHCLAVMALGDAFRLTRDPALKGPAQAGVNFLVAAQHDGGGWRYSPRMAGDTSVTGFALRALVGAKLAGLAVPARTLKSAGKFLDSVTAPDGETVYIPGAGKGTPAMTAVATLCRQLLGTNPRNPTLAKGIKHALKNQPADAAPGTLYFGYYAHRSLYHAGGEEWDEWNAGKKSFRDALVKAQDDGTRKQGNAGSWQGNDLVGGRLGATSFALMSLLVYREAREKAGLPKGKP